MTCRFLRSRMAAVKMILPMVHRIAPMLPAFSKSSRSKVPDVAPLTVVVTVVFHQLRVSVLFDVDTHQVPRAFILASHASSLKEVADTRLRIVRADVSLQRRLGPVSHDDARPAIVRALVLAGYAAGEVIVEDADLLIT